MYKLALLVLALGTIAINNGMAQSIPLDPSVRTGKLGNGFTYYIRHNAEPKKRVYLYLVNKVGSILEDDDQQGLAHFMEHMNFNGTKHFPKNDLVDYLQKAGVSFGADLNAYTAFDETVYELPIPTDDPAMFGNGIRIMRDWAQEATLDPAEIDKERGVILEEERLGKGAGDRMSRQLYPMLFNHSRYAERIPIGKDEILTQFKPEAIKRFHHDWYRPDLQALIVVGDVDINEAEKLVKEKFADLKNPVNERTRTQYPVLLTGKSQFMVVTDKENTTTNLEIMMKHKAQELKTQQDYLLQIKISLLNRLMSNRCNAELVKLNWPASTGISMDVGGLINGIDVLSFSISAKEGRLGDSFEQSWKMMERIKRYGFTQSELDRVKQNYLKNFETNVNEQDKTSSLSYVKEYQNLFLQGQASPGIAWEYQFTKDHIGKITLDDIADLMNEYLGSKDVNILVSAPQKDKDALPDSVTIAKWIKNISEEKLAPFKDEQVNQPLLAVEPKPGTVVAKKEIPQIGVTQLRLSNGVKVILKPTDFKNDHIYYRAFSPGGASLYDNTDFDAATNAGGVIGNLGLGNLNPVQLSQVLTGKVASSGVNIGIRSTSVNGGASQADLETALQLTYLQFTAPGKDTLLYRNAMGNLISTLANRYADPNHVFTDTVNYVMSNYNYRMAPPTAQRAEKITLQRTYDIYKERFADASGFTFVFVGSFNPALITPLLEKYLGSLPSTYKNTKARDIGAHIPPGIITKKIYKGTENKATVIITYSGNYSFSTLANLELKALNDILQIKVLQDLREGESEVYSPSVRNNRNKYPQNRFAINIQFGCAPKNADHLVAMVGQEIKKMREQGPDANDIEKFKAAYQKNMELALKDNGFWLNYLVGQCEDEEDLLQVLEAQKDLDKITVTSLKAAAANFLSGQNTITFELLPEKSTE